jgi:UDP-2-acetamido-3-amino-2,3-dideoxy-glucuronate N-acetyltransferase
MLINQQQNVIIENGAIVAPTASLGCFIKVCCDAKIGGNAILDGLVIVPPHVQIEDMAHISYGVCFLMPNSKDNPTKIGRGAILGVNAIIHSGVSIGPGAVVLPGTQILRSIPPMAIVEGSPARIVGYVGAPLSMAQKFDSTSIGITQSKVRGVTVHKMPSTIDIRGNLTVGEFCRSIPFNVKRYFLVYDVPSLETRGEHAHRECHQFLICVSGSCSVVADDGNYKQEFLLDKPDIGIYIPPMIWGIQYKYSSDAVLLVFASDYYDSDDYVRNYDEFVQLAKKMSLSEKTDK